MIRNLGQQGWAAIWAALAGLGLGIGYDMLRGLRLTVRGITLGCDLLFSLEFLLAMLALALYTGGLRIYQLLAAAGAAAAYFLTLSGMVLRLWCVVLEAIRRQIRKMVRRCKKSVIFLRKLQKKLFSTWQKWGTISIIPFFLKKKSLQSGKAAYTNEMRREKASGCPVGGRNGVESGRAGDGTSPADAAGTVAGAGNHCSTGANRCAAAGRRWRKR